MRACPAIPARARRCRVHRIPLRVCDDRETPLGSGTAGDIDLIWVKREAEYFCGRGWTGFGDLPVGQNEQAERSIRLGVTRLA
jgi:hypothetical protein